MRSTFFWENPSASLSEKRVRRKAKRKKEGAFGETRSDRFCLCAAGVKKPAQRSVPRNQVQRVRVQHGKETAFQNHADAFAARAHGKPAARGHGRLSTQRVAEKKGGVGDLCLSASHGNVSGKVARKIGIFPPGSTLRPAPLHVPHQPAHGNVSGAHDGLAAIRGIDDQRAVGGEIAGEAGEGFRLSLHADFLSQRRGQRPDFRENRGKPGALV